MQSKERGNRVEYSYIPKGVCAKEFVFEMEGNTVKSLSVKGGCPGNLLGIGRLIQGKDISEITASFQGVKCGARNTSCPEQIALALKAYQEAE